MLLSSTFFSAMLFTVLYKVVQGDFECVDPWNPKLWQFKWKLLSSALLWYCLLLMVCKVVRTFYSGEETPYCGHWNESLWAVLFCGAVCYALQGGSNLWFYGWNPKADHLKRISCPCTCHITFSYTVHFIPNSKMRTTLQCPWFICRRTGSIHLIPKWQKTHYSFVSMLTGPCCLVLRQIFLCTLQMTSRQQRPINNETKE